MESGFPSSIPLAFPPLDDDSDGPSSSHRLALGIVTVCGCYFGLLHLISGLALASAGTNKLSAVGSLRLLVVAILTGAAVAGTINRRAEMTGLVLGLLAAPGFMALETADGRLPLEGLWIGVVVSLGLVVVVGGLAGRLMVPPAPDLPMLGQVDRGKIEAVLKPLVRVVWWRIALGLAVVLIGTAYVDTIRYYLAKMLSGNGGTFVSGKLIAWQISLLVSILGGMALCKAPRCLKQGVIAGFLAAAGVIVVLTRYTPSPPLVLEFWFDQLNVVESCPEMYAAVAGSVWCAVAVGGWFGSHLFPRRRS